MLRLWRVVKIIDEFSVQASESMEGLRREIEDLEKQNRDLRTRIAHHEMSPSPSGQGDDRHGS